MSEYLPIKKKVMIFDLLRDETANIMFQAI